MKDQTPEQQIEQIAIDKLVPYARNSRTHDDAQVAQIAASIREFGFTNPVLIAADDTIIAGHGRVMAARKLGLDKVPCLRLSHLTETQRRAYVIADNQLALNSGWNEEMLGLELADLRELDFDLNLVGFDADSIEQFLNHDEKEESNDIKINCKYEVVAECDHEDHQRMVYNILNEKGIKCRLATL
jgi:ParB-like chromosome segregation protein Spo0J